MVSATRLGFTIQVIEPDQIFGEYTVIEIAGGEIVDSKLQIVMAPSYSWACHNRKEMFFNTFKFVVVLVCFQLSGIADVDFIKLFDKCFSPIYQFLGLTCLTTNRLDWVEKLVP